MNFSEATPFIVGVTDPWVHGAALAIVAALVAVAGLYHFQKDIQQKKTYAPMAPTSLFQTIRAMSGDDRPWFMLRTARSMGTSVYRLPLPFVPAPTCTVVGDSKLAREILSDKETSKPPMYRNFARITNGIPSLYSSSGAFWHSRRKGVSPGFSSKHIHRMNAVAAATCDKWIETRLKPLINEGKSFDVGEEMIDLFLMAITETAFEYKLSPAEVKMFKEDISITFRVLFSKEVGNPLRKVFGWMLPEVRQARQAAKRVQALNFKIIEAYKKLQNPTKGTIIDLIMHNDAYKSDAERTADMTILLLAGHDTPAYTVAFTLKELAMSPGLQEQLRQSINNDDCQAPHQLESVRNTIKESLRLNPVSAQGSVRRVGRDFTTKGGKMIPAGSVTMLPYIIMMRDQSIYGDDCDCFNPARWETATHEMNQAFLPYAFGNQNCVGQTLANAEMYCILPRIISQFELTIDQPGHCKCHFTMKPVETMLRAKPVSPPS